MFQSGHEKKGGRQKGTRNKKTLLDVNALLLQAGVYPIEKLIEIAECEESSITQKIHCWQEICKYAYPKVRSKELVNPKEHHQVQIHLIENDGTKTKL